MIAREPVIECNNLRFTRRQVEDVLLLPGKVPDFTTKENLAALRQRLAEDPAEALKLGLRQIPVYAVYAYNCEGGRGHQWSMREQKVWVDHATNKPIEGVIEILDSLPRGYQSLGRRGLLELLPPTYCRRRVDAQALVQVLTKLGDAVDLDECRFRAVAKDDSKAIARFNREMTAANRAGLSDDELMAHETSQGVSVELAVVYDGAIVGASILRMGASSEAEVRLSPRVRDPQIGQMLIGRCLGKAAGNTEVCSVTVRAPLGVTIG